MLVVLRGPRPGNVQALHLRTAEKEPEIPQSVDMDAHPMTEVINLSRADSSSTLNHHVSLRTWNTDHVASPLTDDLCSQGSKYKKQWADSSGVTFNF